ncbi:VCBS repeat-containing protein [Myxococcaceae bacterium JPH2]|nr:VCBS repeat-containing protein [Myxococcaceae bacterium JPH2]
MLLLVALSCVQDSEDWGAHGSSAHSALVRLDMSPDAIIPTELAADGYTVGKLTGTGAASPDGAATYSLPIWVPAGRAGMQPDLVLSYQSRAGNGPVGLGWTLGPVSTIARCRRTMAQDGRVETVTFTQADAFCLDGQRLVLMSGVYGASGAEYRTEMDTFIKVVSLDADALGPAQFRVYMKDGRILTFGKLNNSTLQGQRVSARPYGLGGVAESRDGKLNRLAWSLVRVEDRSGNYISYFYGQDEGGGGGGATSIQGAYEQWLERIEYTGGPSQGPTRSVVFDYQPEARPDSAISYTAGFKLKNTKRLARLRMLAPNPTVAGLVRSYEFSYVQDPTSRISTGAEDGASLLSSVTQCDGLGVCMRPVVFSWASGSLEYEEINTGIADVKRNLHSVDVNGDGRDDLLYTRAETGRLPGWRMRLASADGFGLDYPVDLPDEYSMGGERFSDLDADGRIDVSTLRWENTGGPSILNRVGHYVFNGTKFDLRELEVDSERLKNSPWVSDFDGDGYPDLIRLREVNNHIQLSCRSNLGGSFGPYSDIVVSDVNDNAQMVANLDGTNRSSLLFTEKRSVEVPGGGHIYEKVGLNYWALSVRNGVWEKSETTLTRLDADKDDDETADGPQILFADVNGDGLPDAIAAQDAGGDVSVQINTGGGFAVGALQTLPADCKLPAFLGDNGVRVFDYNQDGREDLVLLGRRGDDVGPQLVKVLVSTGAGFTCRVLTIPQGEPATLGGYGLSQLLDFNGDGLRDLVQVVDGTLRLYLRKGLPSALLLGVQDSAGARMEFSYKPITDSSVYTPSFACVAPQRCVHDGMWLVSEVRSEMGSGGWRPTNFQYEDGRSDILGRGWLGFAAIVARDGLSGATVRTESDNHSRLGTFYPYAKLPGRVVSQIEDVGSARVHRQHQESQYAASVRDVLDGQKILTVLPASGWTESYERFKTEGATQGLQQRSASIWEYETTYGNLKKVRRTVSAGGEVIQDDVRELQYYPANVSDWLVELVQRESEVSTVGATAVTRVTGYTYSAQTGLLESLVVEPGDARFQLSTTYVRASDGLVVETRQEAAGYSPRSVFFEYDPLDRVYPIESRNAMGHVVRFAYHPGLGVLASRSDVNGVSISAQFDGFGRLRKQDNPTLSDVTVSYRACAAPCSWEVVSSVAGGQKTVSAYDKFGRRLSEQWKAFGGEDVRSVYEYDELGRLVASWSPSPTGYQSVVTRFLYDALGRVVAQTNSDGTVRTTRYVGGQISERDEKGNERIIQLDALGRPRTSTDEWSDAPGGGRHVVTQYSYGPFGVKTTILDGYGKGTAFEYDKLGRAVLVRDSDRGLQITNYSPFGEVLNVTDGNGDVTAYTRDSLGRVVMLTNRDGISRFGWDVSPNGIGKLANHIQEGTDTGSFLDDTVAVYSYDSLSRLVTETWSVEARLFAPINRTYDSYGRLQSIAYPQVAGRRLVVENEYAEWGHLRAVRGAGGGSTYWSALSRNGVGQLTGESFGNGLVGVRRYDLRGRPIFMDTSIGGQSLQTLAYEYEPNGNLRGRHDRVGQISEEFRYDSLERLSQWSVFQNCSSSQVVYSYDEIGNLTKRDGQGQTLNYFYEGTGGAGPHAVTRTTMGGYTYDAKGNQLTAPGRLVEYTTFDLPRRIVGGAVEASFRYDAIGSRVVKRTPEEVTTYIGGLYQERRSVAGAAVHVFSVVGAEGPVAQVVWTVDSDSVLRRDETSYLHVDSLGSVGVVTDAGGQVVERLKYEPFGGRRYPHSLSTPVSRGGGNVRQGFTGHEHDDEFGLINMRGRVYDSVLARFLSPDAFIPNPLSSQALNRYSYVYNNPLRYTDPTGFLPREVAYDDWGSGGAGANHGPGGTLRRRAKVFAAANEEECTIPDAAGQGACFVSVGGSLDDAFGDAYARAGSNRAWFSGGSSKGNRSFFASFVVGAPLLQNTSVATGEPLFLSALRQMGIGSGAASFGILVLLAPSQLDGPSCEGGGGPCDASKPEDSPPGVAETAPTSTTDATTEAAKEVEETGAEEPEPEPSAEGAGAGKCKPMPECLKRPPNPYGKKGGPEHQAKVKEIVEEVTTRGLTAKEELRVEITDGLKSVRYADVAAVDPVTKTLVELHQVGRQTQSGLPVSRERKAIQDLETQTGIRPFFHPYNILPSGE